ncbi:MAG TPA: hypothetical protein VMS11_11880 [Solirubrobacterales bacterium]|nr:hypothetical protein [Solirubrobacterales bacterium]
MRETSRIEPERRPTVTLPRNQLIALIVGVCILSAAIGSGLALLAQTGPAGPAGKQGKRGPQGKQGPEGPSGAAEIGGLEEQVGELEGRIEGVEELEGRIDELESEISGGIGPSPSELCEELGVDC